MSVYSGATNQISHLEMWTRDSELISVEMLSHHLCPAGPVAWGIGVSNTVITQVEKTTGWMAGPLNDLQFCCWWLNTLLQPVNEQCWSNEAEEGEDLLEVRGKVWGRVRGGQCTGTHTHTDEMEKYLALKMRAHIGAWKTLMIGASGYRHIHLCFDDFLICSFLSTTVDIPGLLYALVCTLLSVFVLYSKSVWPGACWVGWCLPKPSWTAFGHEALSVL